MTKKSFPYSTFNRHHSLCICNCSVWIENLISDNIFLSFVQVSPDWSIPTWRAPTTSSSRAKPKLESAATFLSSETLHCQNHPLLPYSFENSQGPLCNILNSQRLLQYNTEPIHPKGFAVSCVGHVGSLWPLAFDKLLRTVMFLKRTDLFYNKHRIC